MRKYGAAILLLACSHALLRAQEVQPALPAGDFDRDFIVRALLDRSRLLADVRFAVPAEVYRQYLLQLKLGPAAPAPPPVALIAEEGLYQLDIPAEGGQATTTGKLTATVRLRILQPGSCVNLPVLAADRAWEQVTVNARPASLAKDDKFLLFTPDQAGEFVISATAPMPFGRGGTIGLPIPKTVMTFIQLDSPRPLDITPDGQPQPQLSGSPEKGTHGRLALNPGAALNLTYAPAEPVRQRPPRFELRGNLAWNLDAAGQQLVGALDVAILGGQADSIELTLPPSAERVTITGPDVRDCQVRGGTAEVFFRGRIGGQTRLDLQCEFSGSTGVSPVARDGTGETPVLPSTQAIGTGTQRLSAITIRDGHWTGGSVIVTTSAGTDEVLEGDTSGLKAVSLADVPASALGMLAGRAVLAYQITGRDWSLLAESVNLGEFALRESIADLAHFQVLYRDGGEMMVKAAYEIRNRNKQFLRLTLPAGAALLSARVNDKTCPISPLDFGEPRRAADSGDVYLLPLVRSPASVKGLVSFPVEAVVLCRAGALAKSGGLSLPLPRVDLPIAYAWCEAYVPEDLDVSAWSGPLRNVERYSSETATAQLGYGRGELVEGYRGMVRPVTTPKPPPAEKKPSGGILGWFVAKGQQPDMERPVPGQAGSGLIQIPIVARRPAGPSVQAKPGQTPGGLYSSAEGGRAVPSTRPAVPSGSGTVLLGGQREVRGADQEPGSLLNTIELAKPAPAPAAPKPLQLGEIPAETKLSLARNYYRAGQEAYEKGDLPTAEEAFGQVNKLAPGTSEAANSLRYSSNIAAVAGKAKLESRQEKLAGKEVQREVSAAQQGQSQQRQEILESARQAAREGKYQFARQQLAAAESMWQKEVIEKAVEPAAGDTGLVIQSTKQLKEELEVAAKQEEGQNVQLREQLQRLETAGDYAGALQVAKRLSSQGGAADGKKLEDLAVKTAQQKIAQQRAAWQKHQVNVQVAEIQQKRTELARRQDEVVTNMVPARQLEGFTSPEEDALRQKLDAEARREGRPDGRASENVFLIPLANARAEEVSAGLQTALSARGRMSGPDRKPPRIQIDARTNYLVVRASPEELRVIEDLVRQLDAGSQVDQATVRRQDKPPVELREAQIPWYDELKYPKDWPEITQRRGGDGGGGGGQAAGDQLVGRRLRQNLPKLEFSGIGFADVVQFLRDVSNTNIYVNWGAMTAVGIDRTTPVNVKLTNVTFEKALRTILDDVGGVNPLGFAVGEDGTLVVSTKDDLASKTVTRVYDIRDLIVATPHFAGPSIATQSGGNNAAPSGGLFGNNAGENAVSRQQSATDVLNLVRNTIARDSWLENSGTTGSIREVTGNIIVTQTAENQEAVAELLRQVRGVRAPQVQLGTNIAGQRAKGLVDADEKQSRAANVPIISDIPALNRAFTNRAAVRDEADYVRFHDGAHETTIPVAGDPELKRFIERNYDWAGFLGDVQADFVVPGPRSPELPPSLEALQLKRAQSDGGWSYGDLAARLSRNLGQKVPVGSLNLNLDADTAAAAGVAFAAGANNLVYAVIDEAQFRTLLELEARSGATGNVARNQETIVGTDALLANSLTANLAYAGDRGNNLFVAGNSIDLPLERYLVIAGDGQLTAVKTSAMRHWTIAAAAPAFAQVPPNIDLPRVGRMVKFEKTLVDSGEDLQLKANYVWKGAKK